MSEYTKISLIYLICISAGLGAAYAEGTPIYALVQAAIVSVLVVAAIFAGMIYKNRQKRR